MRAPFIAIALTACFSMPPRPQAGGGDAGTDASTPHDGQLGGDGALGEFNIAFVSSAMYDGDLGGTAGADTACRSLAHAAGLPGVYVAWLGTSTASAVSRLGSARGWVRPDGLPVIDTIADLTANKMMYPIAIDDLGSAHYDETSHVLTGASADGTATTATCSNYTSTAGSGTVGETDGTYGNWTNDGVALACSTELRLDCFGIDLATAVAPPKPPPNAKIAFVTNATFAASGGLTGADSLCNSEGAVLNIGSFVALLATSTATAASRAASGIYARPDGVALGPIGNTLAAPINVTAAGTYISAPAWTGAASPTLPLTSIGSTTTTCNNWSAATGSGEVGAITIASTSSFFDRTAACNDTTTHLYCVQQ